MDFKVIKILVDLDVSRANCSEDDKVIESAELLRKMSNQLEGGALQNIILTSPSNIVAELHYMRCPSVETVGPYGEEE